MAGRRDRGTSFATGFALGLFGSCAGLLFAPLIDRDCVPGAAVGAGVNVAILTCLGLMDWLIPGMTLFSVLPEATPPHGGGITVHPIDHEPVPRFPVALIAIGSGIVVTTIGALGALWLWVHAGDDAEFDDEFE